MLKNDIGPCGKSFDGSVKDRCFSILYNDWRNMFININEKNCFLIFFEMFVKHVKMSWPFQGTLKLSVYINYLQLFFPIFSIFLFLLVLFQLTPLWIVTYLIWHQWLCFIINVWLGRNSHFQWKKYMIGKWSFVSRIGMFSLVTKWDK